MMNRVILVGRLTADPELRYTATGIPVVNFRIAVDRRFKTQDGKKEADFFNIVAWRGTAEFVANYMTKGRLVGVDGRLQLRQWETGEGQKRSTVEVVAEQVQALDKAPKTEGAAAGEGDGADPNWPPVGEEE